MERKEGKTKNYFKLINNLIELSVSKIWEESKNEWFIQSIFYEQDNTCLCSHFPITECIVIQNSLNKNESIIGNCCINIIMGKDFKKIFYSLKNNRINQEILDISYKKDIIDEWEYKFLLNTKQKRRLTDKQRVIFDKLKSRIFNNQFFNNGKL